MFLIDDLVLGPTKFLLWLARQVDDAVAGERDAMRQDIIGELGHLNASLEAGEISEDEFASRESVLLDRLDQTEAEMRDGPNLNNPPNTDD
jgi:hypothetical protein